MTALADFERLEAAGTWRPGPGAPGLDVIVSLGEASLIITDTAEQAVAHWSLAAIEPRSAGIFAPGPDAEEVLELDDATMIAAITRIQAALGGQRRERTRRHRLLLACAAGALLLIGAVLLPQVLTRHAAAVVPQATRAELDRALLDRLPAACSTPEGTAALDRLAERLGRARAPRIVVVPDGVAGVAGLPGGTLVLDRSLVEVPRTPALAAGTLLAETTRMAERDPLVDLLETAGPLAAPRLLTTGTLSPDALDRYADRLAEITPEPAPPAALGKSFTAARVNPRPYAETHGVPLPPVEKTEPILPDGAWVALQGICGG